MLTFVQLIDAKKWPIFIHFKHLLCVFVVVNVQAVCLIKQQVGDPFSSSRVFECSTQDIQRSVVNYRCSLAWDGSVLHPHSEQTFISLNDDSCSPVISFPRIGSPDPWVRHHCFHLWVTWDEGGWGDITESVDQHFFLMSSLCELSKNQLCCQQCQECAWACDASVPHQRSLCIDKPVFWKEIFRTPIRTEVVRGPGSSGGCDSSSFHW